MVLLILASGAYAEGIAIPGATYKGVASGGADITFTVSADGTLVDSYSIAGAVGHEAGGHTCDFAAAGAFGIWDGAPIDGNAFQYNLGSAVRFQGQITGPQTASGSFRLSDPANGSDPACDTGTVAWRASTTATPPGGPATGGGTPGGGTTGGGATGGGPPSGSGTSKPPKVSYATWVSLRRSSAKWLRGSVRASSPACISHRTVYLMLGRRRIATTKTNARGSYAVRVTPKLRKRKVRAVVPMRRTSYAICAAGSSKFLTA